MNFEVKTFDIKIVRNWSNRDYEQKFITN